MLPQSRLIPDPSYLPRYLAALTGLFSRTLHAMNEAHGKEFDRFMADINSVPEGAQLDCNDRAGDFHRWAMGGFMRVSQDGCYDPSENPELYGLIYDVHQNEGEDAAKFLLNVALAFDGSATFIRHIIEEAAPDGTLDEWLTIIEGASPYTNAEQQAAAEAAHTGPGTNNFQPFPGDEPTKH